MKVKFEITWINYSFTIFGVLPSFLLYSSDSFVIGREIINNRPLYNGAYVMKMHCKLDVGDLTNKLR